MSQLSTCPQGCTWNGSFPPIADIQPTDTVTDMTDHPDQAARDEWQTRLYDASYRFGIAMRKLNDTNPWPENPVLAQAINTLATELWDRCFSVTEIRTALEEAAAGLSRYAAGQEVRS
jgi:hypothetical protein